MLFFRRNKIKLLLIEDYIKLKSINYIFNTSNNCENFNIRINNLIDVYEDLFVKLKMNDLSLLLLKKDLNNVDYSSCEALIRKI